MRPRVRACDLACWADKTQTLEQRSYHGRSGKTVDGTFVVAALDCPFARRIFSGSLRRQSMRGWLTLSMLRAFVSELCDCGGPARIEREQEPRKVGPLLGI